MIKDAKNIKNACRGDHSSPDKAKVINNCNGGYQLPKGITLIALAISRKCVRYEERA